ncbi:hypothetical protein I4U23_024593 [Adineta vaga]|nr:hypothetical protein I4U23_024593 [Adineta vaga]
MNDSSWNSTYVTTLNINGSGQQLDGDSPPSGSRQDSNAIIPFVTTTFQRNLALYDTILNSHLILPSFATLSGSNLCGPLSPTTYSFFFRKIWGILFALLHTVLPTIILIIVTIDIFRRLRLQQKRKLNGPHRRRAFLDRQILIIMLTSIFLFFATQIPLSLFNILLSPVLRFRLSMTQALEITSICTFIASINFATTFYVHCLTSKLFRNEFYYIKSCHRRRRVGVIAKLLDRDATQTRTQDIRMKRRGNQQDCSIETVH